MVNPDVVGFTLIDAKKILEQEGVEINSITLTAPPKETKGIPDDLCRVIKQNVINDKNVELIVCKPL